GGGGGAERMRESRGQVGGGHEADPSRLRRSGRQARALREIEEEATRSQPPIRRVRGVLPGPFVGGKIATATRQVLRSLVLPVGRVKIARARASRARGGIQWGSLYRERHRKHALHTLPHAGCSSRTARPAAR